MITVLIVEDNTFTARVVAEFLADLGYVVRVAGTVREAQEAPTPSVAVVDNKLPDGNGADVVAIMQGRGVPCIPVTGSGEWEGGTPPMDPLVKPFSMAELAALVAARLAEGG